MSFLKKFFPLALVAVLTFFLVPSSSPFAATKSAPAATVQTASSSAPNPLSNPVLASILKMSGVKIYYMGNHSQMDGWYIIKDGRVQIAYTTPDNKSAVIGALFDENGLSVTAGQMRDLMNSNPEVAALMMKAAQEQQAMVTAGVAAANSPKLSGVDSMPSVAISPGEKLLQELSTTAGVTLGSAKPQLYMIMDPSCPHCQATWKMLRDSVFKNVFQIRMIPIGDKDTDNERAAAQLLHIADPLNAWDKYVAGDKSQLAGIPDPMLLTATRSNHLLIDSWNIRETPYMAYRGKDGRVKIIKGEPADLAVLLSDMAQ